MKTPKRNPDEKRGRYARHYLIIDRSRWKRKNRIAQHKRTIARLADESRRFREFRLGGHLKIYSPEWDAFIVLSRLKTPTADATPDEKFEYWVALREVGKLVLNAACLAAMAYGEAKANAESGQQACDAQNAENATQETLICTDAEQLTERKGN